MAVVSDYTGLLSGASFSASGGRPAFVSYSFPVAVPDYLLAQFPGSGLATFRAFTPDQQAAARAAVAAWAAESPA